MEAKLKPSAVQPMLSVSELALSADWPMPSVAHAARSDQTVVGGAPSQTWQSAVMPIG